MVEEKEKESAKSKESKSQALVRLNFLLKELGIASRRKADELIRQGRVSVDGKTTKELGLKVKRSSIVQVDGEKVRPTLVPKHSYLFHKPDLVLTSRQGERDKKTIFDLPALRNLPSNVQPVGRLDYRSEGLIILTNDGDLAQALSHPKFGVKKTYAVLLHTTIQDEEIKKLRTGIKLEDGIAKAETVRPLAKAFLGSAKRGQWIEIIITEGRNRLVRRLLEALGIKVLRLVRIAVGALRLPEDLAAGHISPMDPELVKSIKSLKPTPPTTPIKKKRRRRAKPATDPKTYAERKENSSRNFLRKERLRKKRGKPSSS